MAEFGVEGSELKKMVKAAKKGPVAFGFNPGKDEDSAYLGMHKLKPPALLGKDAKESGEGGKFAFGMAQVQGKTMSLTCERELPGLAKRLKKFLKSQKVMLNIVVMDADGNVLDSDIDDDLPDDPDLQDDPEDQPQAAEEAAPPALDPATVLKRLGDLRGQITALPPDAQARVVGPFKQLVDMAKAGELARADEGATRLEQAIRALAAQAPAAPAAPDPQLARLTQALAALRGQAATVTDERTRSAVLAALDRAAGFIDAGEVENATGILKKVQDILKAAPRATDPGTAPANPQEAEWNTRYGALEASINEALSKGLVADVGELRRLNDFATASAMDNAYDKALALLPRIEKMLAEGGEDPTRQVPPDVQPFAKSRLEWGKSRSLMMDEVRRLQAEIEAKCRQVGGLEEVIASLPDLLVPLQSIDQRLEDKLDEVVSSLPGERRNKLKAEARALIEVYRAELTKPFFVEVDTSNGFAKVAVTSTARDALSRVEAVLAA